MEVKVELDMISPMSIFNPLTYYSYKTSRVIILDKEIDAISSNGARLADVSAAADSKTISPGKNA